MIQMNLLTKQEKTLRLRKQIHSCQRVGGEGWGGAIGGEGWGGAIAKEFRKVMYTLLYLKWITNKNLLYSTWTLLNVMCQPGW